MEKPKFYPPVKFTFIKFSRSNSTHVTTSRTSTRVPNFIAVSLQVAYPQICEILRFCDFFVVLSCPGYTFSGTALPVIHVVAIDCIVYVCGMSNSIDS